MRMPMAILFQKKRHSCLPVFMGVIMITGYMGSLSGLISDYT